MTVHTEKAATQTLTDRYVWAAVRTVPDDQRHELDLEIRERIGDAIQARIDAGESPAAAERVALVELGDPERLAAAYVDRPLHLIGPRYYLEWLRLTKMLFTLVLPIVIVVIGGGALISMSNGSGSLGGVFAAVFGGGLTVAVHLAFWPTLVFALIERSENKVDLAGEWKPENLPEVPGAKRPGVTELVARVTFQVFFAGALLYQAFLSPVTNAAGDRLPVLDLGPWLLYLLAYIALEIGFEVVLYRQGGWTRALAGVNVVLNLLFAVPIVILLLGGLLNQAFFTEVGWPEGGDVNGPLTVVTWVTIIVIAVNDSWRGLRKAL